MLHAFGRNINVKRENMPGFLHSLVPDVVSPEGASILSRYYTYSDHANISLRDMADLVDITGT